MQFASGFQIPDLQCVVGRSRDRTPAVWTHRHAIDRFRVALQCAQFAASFQISNLQRVVRRSRDRTPAVRTHRHTINPKGVAFQRPDQRCPRRMKCGTQQSHPRSGCAVDNRVREFNPSRRRSPSSCSASCAPSLRAYEMNTDLSPALAIKTSQCNKSSDNLEASSSIATAHIKAPGGDR
jgi:hypothetical protein